MTQMTDIKVAMAQRPRLTVEFDEPDINYHLKVIALARKTTVKRLLLEYIATLSPELKQLVKKELS